MNRINTPRFDDLENAFLTQLFQQPTAISSPFGSAHSLKKKPVKQDRFILTNRKVATSSTFLHEANSKIEDESIESHTIQCNEANRRKRKQPDLTYQPPQRGEQRQSQLHTAAQVSLNSYTGAQSTSNFRSRNQLHSSNQWSSTHSLAQIPFETFHENSSVLPQEIEEEEDRTYYNQTLAVPSVSGHGGIIDEQQEHYLKLLKMNLHDDQNSPSLFTSPCKVTKKGRLNFQLNHSEISEEMRSVFQQTACQFSFSASDISTDVRKSIKITQPVKLAQFELALKPRPNVFFENVFDWCHKLGGLSAIADVSSINLGDFIDPNNNILLSEMLKKPIQNSIFELIVATQTRRAQQQLIKVPVQSSKPKQRDVAIISSEEDESIVSVFNLFTSPAYSFLDEFIEPQQLEPFDTLESVFKIERSSLSSSPSTSVEEEPTYLYHSSNGSSPMHNNPELEARYTAVKFALNGNILAAGRSDGVLEIYDISNLTSASQVFVGKVSHQAITCIAANSNSIAIALISSEVLVLNVRNPQQPELVALLESQNSSPIVSLEWNPFSDFSLAATTSTGYLNLYNTISSNKLAIREIRVSEFSVKALAWHPSQQNCLITGGLDGQIKVFDFSSNTIIARKTLSEHIYRIVFSPKHPEKFLALTGYERHQPTGKESSTLFDIIEDPNYSQATRLIVLSLPNINKITHIDISTLRSSDLFLSADYTTAYIFSRDNQLTAWKVFEEEEHKVNKMGSTSALSNIFFDPR